LGRAVAHKAGCRAGQGKGKTEYDQAVLNEGKC